MAQLHQFRPPRRPRRPLLSCDTLAWITVGAGACAASVTLFVPELRGLSTLIGLGVAVGGYMAFYDRCRG